VQEVAEEPVRCLRGGDALGHAAVPRQAVEVPVVGRHVVPAAVGGDEVVVVELGQAGGGNLLESRGCVDVDAGAVYVASGRFSAAWAASNSVGCDHVLPKPWPAKLEACSPAAATLV
jgi:hypothetical protein